VTHPLRQGLELVREHLKKEAQHELRTYVEAVLAPRGWIPLKDSETSPPTSPLSLTIPKSFKAALLSAAKEFDVVLASLAEEGFRAVLETDWLPPKTVNSRSLPTAPAAGKDAEQDGRAVLQLQVDDPLRQRVQAIVADLSERAGYRVTLSSIALSWMADQLGVRRPGENTQPLLLQFIPRTWCAHWEAVAAERGVTLQSVMEDGIRALQDGSWTMPKPVRSAKGSGVIVTADSAVRKLSVRVDTELLDYLDVQAPVLAAEFGRKVFPAGIGLAILKDRLGLPAE
jgi:hypothetical protein